MHKIITFSELSKSQIKQYRSTVQSAFPKVIFQSEVVKYCWPIIEKYFPSFQLFWVDENDSLIGFINAIPIFWDRPLDELPDEGWDWLVERGISGFEKNITPNCLGGLQIIVAKNQLGKGYSKLIIAEAKKIQEKLNFNNFIIPIRPTLKSNFPEMKMSTYINFKVDDKIYDPWIRTHKTNGAKFIKVCPNAMNIKGNVEYWESLMDEKIVKSGYHVVPGALNPVMIDLDRDRGEYREANIWINYG